MNYSVQIIYGAAQQPLFAVLPYEAYRNWAGQNGGGVAFKDEEQRFINLPHGGPKARLDVVRLVDFLSRKGIVEMPVNQRAQAYAKFPVDQHMTLDPLIRREFLGMNSPYLNTMQATNAVVDALVQTGLFERSKMKHEAFFRAVNSVKLNVEKVPDFLARFTPLAEEEKLHMAETVCA